MGNRFRAAYACLRGRPVIAHCQTEGPISLTGENVTIVGNTFVSSPDLTPPAT